MDDIYANVEKPLDNKSNRQLAGKEGEDIYINNDVIHSHSTPTPNTGGTADAAPSKAVRCLVLLCFLLLVGIIGLLCVHFTRDESELMQLKVAYTNLTDERDNLKVAYTNLTDERDHLKVAYTNLTAERDHLKVAYTNMTDERDQLLDRHNTLKKQYGKLNCGCKKDYWTMFGDGCYYVSTEKKDWERSRQYCQERGADLVIINSQEEQGFVVSLDKRVWIGLTDRVEEGVWKWVDGTPLIQSFWYPPQPDNNGEGAGKEEDCAENYNIEKKWNDVTCSHANHFICEINI